jgi:hypothetical protein
MQLVPFVANIDHGAIEQPLAVTRDPKQAQELIVGFVDGVIDDTKTMRATMAAIGPPALPDGDQLHLHLLSTFDGVISHLEGISAGARTEPINSIASARAEVRRQNRQLSEAIAPIGQGVSGSELAELAPAIGASPACQSLQRSISPTPDSAA